MAYIDGSTSKAGATIEAEARTYADAAAAASLTAAVKNTGGGREVYRTVASASGSQTVDLALGNEHRWTLTGDVTTVTLTGATNGVVCTVVLALTQGGSGGYNVTWPSSIAWPNSAKPHLIGTPVGSTDYVTLITYDGGTTWYGSHTTTVTAEIAGQTWIRPTLLEPFAQELANALNTANGANQRLAMVLFRAPRTFTASKFVVPGGGTAPTAPTQIRFSLHTVPESYASAGTGNATLVANSANVASTGADRYAAGTGTLAASNGPFGGTTFDEYVMAFSTDNSMPTSYELIAGRMYAFGFYFLGTTAPTLHTMQILNKSINKRWPPARSMQFDSQASFPTGALNLASGATVSTAMWLALGA